MLPRSWLTGTDTVGIARRLLGCRLVVRGDAGESHAGVRRFLIVEVEAYDGPHDRASHAAKGRTARTGVMFGPAGHWYVYLCYGVHEMLNLVTGPVDYPAAILIRGVEGFSGPGRLTRALGIDRRFNARPATRSTGLWIETPGASIDPARIVASPRVGVDYAGPEWAGKPWRFVLRRTDATGPAT